MSIWTVEDVARIVQCTRSLLLSEVSSSPPPEPGIHPTDWNEWVPLMLRHLLAIERQGYAKPAAVRFIGQEPFAGALDNHQSSHLPLPASQSIIG